MDTLTTSNVCDICRGDLPFIRRGCKRCGIEVPDVNTLGVCASCILHPPVFDSCVSTFMYEGPVTRMVSSFKYSANFAAGRFLAHALSDCLQNNRGRTQSVNGIIPVPIHINRLAERGYNQSLYLAKHVAKEHSIPLLPKLLTKTKATQAQTSIASARLRQKNLTNSFSVSQFDGEKKIKSVYLLDDVITTKATLNEASKVLKESGVEEIHALSVARAPERGIS